ncbi:MAG: choice-of-anchor Q domain-containing protein [Lysobacterales bacterium]
MLNRPLFATALLLAAPLAPAATLTWPSPSGLGPCAGTLQACVNAAAAGDTVLIGADEPLLPDAYTAINEPITIGKSLTLAAAPGIDAVFGPGFNVGFQPTVPGPHQVTISGLVLRQGSVSIRDEGTVAGSVFRVERMRIVEPTAPNAVPCAINFDLQSPSAQVIAGDNVIGGGDTAGELRSGICAFASGAGTTINASLFRNRVTTGAAGLRSGISVVVPAAGGSVAVSGNTVIGPRLELGISVQRAQGTATTTVRIDNNVVSGQSDPAGWGVRVLAGNSTATVVNNTVVFGARGLFVTGFDALPVSGRVANNLVAFHSSTGVSIPDGGASNSHNLVFGNAFNAYTAGPSTVTADPRILRPTHPRPSNGSPAINAGNNADVPSLVLFDADGERRRTLGAVDIGAYEASGDAAERITVTEDTRFFNEAYITPFPVPLTPTEALVGVAGFGTWPMGASAHHLGVYPNPAGPSGWSVFLQPIALQMPVGATFHILSPFGSKTGIRHATAAGNVSGALTTLDDAELNGALNRARIAVPFHRWDGLYHDFPIGMRWVSTSGGRWQIRNEDGAAMPSNQNFNVVVAPSLSPNAFRTTLDAFARRTWRLEHPLLDSNPCAAPIVGRVDDPDVAGDITNPTPFGVVFDPPSGPGAPGRWVVVADAPSGTPTLAAGSAFNVIIDGDQANRCRAPLQNSVFANGFEAGG